MPDFLDLLKQFNRKERHFLVLNAIGVSATDSKSLPLSEDFRKALGHAIHVEVPPDAYATIDFHLDWLAASMAAYHKGLPIEQLTGKPFSNGADANDESRVVTGSIEDIDLLVAFKTQEGKYHVVLIEAKAYGGWDNDQLVSKAKRLKRIFGDNCNGDIKAHFLLTSPKSPDWTRTRLGDRTKKWPNWMHKDGQSGWIELHVSPEPLKVARRDASDKRSETVFKIVRA